MGADLPVALLRRLPQTPLHSLLQLPLPTAPGRLRDDSRRGGGLRADDGIDNQLGVRSASDGDLRMRQADQKLKRVQPHHEHHVQAHKTQAISAEGYQLQRLEEDCAVLVPAAAVPAQADLFFWDWQEVYAAGYQFDGILDQPQYRGE